jgi:hypothetical protein
LHLRSSKSASGFAPRGSHSPLTERQAAEAAGVTVKTWCAGEASRRQRSAAPMMQFVRSYRISFDWRFGGGRVPVSRQPDSLPCTGFAKWRDRLFDASDVERGGERVLAKRGHSDDHLRLPEQLLDDRDRSASTPQTKCTMVRRCISADGARLLIVQAIGDITVICVLSMPVYWTIVGHNTFRMWISLVKSLILLALPSGIEPLSPP